MRALLSVYDKTGIVEFARALHELDVTLVSSGGTASAIADAGIPVTDVAELTGVPAILDHRVVTLHPKVHGGLLADPTNPQHQADMAEYGIEAFDLVVSNLYPFASDPSIELIDIGGPAMVRAVGEEPRARRHRHEPRPVRDGARRAARARPAHRDDPARVRARGVRAHRRVRRRDRRVAPGGRDAAAAHRSCRSRAPTRCCATARTRTSTARATARSAPRAGGTASCSTAASRSATSTSTTPRRRGSSRTTSVTAPVCAIIKHANPCGVAVAGDLVTAYQRALECDERSAFGGIVAFNRPIDDATAAAMASGPQADVVIAPGYEGGAIETLRDEAQEHPAARGARAAPPTPGSSARSAAGSSSRTPRTSPPGATTGGWSPRSRRPPSSGPTPSWRGGCAAT